MTAPDAASLEDLAAWIEDRLDNEHVDRQTICESVAARLRDMAAADRPEDPRVTHARDFLRGARERNPGHMPPSALIRDLVETRRQLGVVLHVLGGAS